MAINKGFDFISQSTKPFIFIYRITKNEDSVCESKIASINSDDKEFTYNSNNLLSYSFSRSVNNLYGEFEVQVKENYAEQNSILDIIQPLDIVKIYEEKNKLSFIGIVETISFGATAGAFNKSVVISGSSIGKLFEMFTFSTDATSMAFFVKEGANTELVNSLTSLCQKNATDGKEGMEIESAFYKVYNTFVEKATDSKYSKIAANGIYDIIKFYFGDNFLKSEGLTFKYQVLKNLYSSDEVSVYSYFRELLPEQVYEIYEDIQESKPVLVLREKPFDLEEWNKLKPYAIKPTLITDYTVSKSNNEVYSCFFSMIQGSPLSPEWYKVINATEGGSDCFINDLEKSKMYGYKPLIVSFTGYQKPSYEANKSEDNYLATTFKALSIRLKKWYSKLDEMYNGSVTVINDFSNKDESGNLKNLVGKTASLCNGTFYVTDEKHNWSYGSSISINYTLSRGGVYSQTEIDNNNGFTPMKNISKRFAELLEKE